MPGNLNQYVCPVDSTGTAISTANPLPISVISGGAVYGPANIATGQATVTTTVGSIIAARAARQTLTIVNEGTTAVRLGPSGTTLTTGILLPGTVGASLTLRNTAALFGLVAAGTAVVSFVEDF